MGANSQINMAKMGRQLLRVEEEDEEAKKEVGGLIVCLAGKTEADEAKIE